jgi:hypothetical protein
MNATQIKFEKEETRYGEDAEWSIMVDGKWCGSIKGEREGMKEASTSRACSMKIIGYWVDLVDSNGEWFPANGNARTALKWAQRAAIAKIGGR